MHIVLYHSHDFGRSWGEPTTVPCAHPSASLLSGLDGCVFDGRLPDWAGPASVTSPLLGKAQPAVLHYIVM